MPGMSRRTGAIAAELAVAVALAGVAGVIGIGILVTAERALRRGATDDARSTVVREAEHALVSDIESATPDSITLRGDTAIDLHALVGTSVVCAVAPGVVVLPGAAGEGRLVPLTVWRQPVEGGDVVMVWDSGGAAWRRAEVDSVRAVADGAGCATTSGFRTVGDSIARVPVWRLRAAFASMPVPGMPVRIVRAVRWTMVRGADRRWALSQRRCPRGVCGASQPVTGPLASPADSGLHVARDGSAVVLTLATTTDARRTRIVVSARAGTARD
jgi:hypothetical protein